eukprot:TRINITY_DN19265_c0_g1_i2.p1 TRINITY_DN19265_c0_g1~~TRINITY_DN19265_c0_g1_i2.p1  ORF type:complete len:114 (-),score=5.34 TRINITY_DN19265_c0_g1_i2:234-575(-)
MKQAKIRLKPFLSPRNTAAVKSPTTNNKESLSNLKPHSSLGMILDETIAKRKQVNEEVSAVKSKVRIEYEYSLETVSSTASTTKQATTSFLEEQLTELRWKNSPILPKELPLL